MTIHSVWFTYRNAHGQTRDFNLQFIWPDDVVIKDEAMLKRIITWFNRPYISEVLTIISWTTEPAELPISA